MFKFLIVLLASLCVAYAAVKVVPLVPVPLAFGRQVGCYVKEFNEVIPVGTSKDSKTSCMKYVCRSQFLEHHTCDAAVAHPPCVVQEFKGQTYPVCCPRVICP